MKRPARLESCGRALMVTLACGTCFHSGFAVETRNDTASTRDRGSQLRGGFGGFQRRIARRSPRDRRALGCRDRRAPPGCDTSRQRSGREQQWDGGLRERREHPRERVLEHGTVRLQPPLRPQPSRRRLQCDRRQRLGRGTDHLLRVSDRLDDDLHDHRAELPSLGRFPPTIPGRVWCLATRRPIA